MSTPDCKTNLEDTLDSDSIRPTNSTLDWDGDLRFPIAKIQRLVLVTPNGPKQILVPGQKLTVGRTLESLHSVPNDYLMSRRHFSIECESGLAILKDEQSTNGTFLNGTRVTASSLSNRDRIVAGLSTFIVRLIF